MGDIILKSYRRKDWRTCDNCVHKNVCSVLNREKECNYHIYDTDVERYGDFIELIKPIYEWLKIHYPNDAYLVVDKHCSEIVMQHKIFLNEK